jgi:predicted lipoprotein with Yx(FWY)xxD motif
VLRDKRVIIVAVAALSAVLTLTACGGGYNPGGQPAAAQNKPAADGGSVDEAGTEDSSEPAGNITSRVTAKKVAKIGNVVVDAKGWVFYRFDEDSAKPSTSNCSGECAELWPPVLTKNGKDLPVLKGIDPDQVGTIKRDDGGWQLTIGNWPVYRYIGDKKPGTFRGQGVGGNWFVVTKTGKKNLSVLPKGTPKPVALPEDSEASTTSDDSSDSGEDAGTYEDSGDYGGY